MFIINAVTGTFLFYLIINFFRNKDKSIIIPKISFFWLMACFTATAVLSFLYNAEIIVVIIMVLFFVSAYTDYYTKYLYSIISYVALSGYIVLVAMHINKEDFYFILTSVILNALLTGILKITKGISSGDLWLILSANSWILLLAVPFVSNVQEIVIFPMSITALACFSTGICGIISKKRSLAFAPQYLICVICVLTYLGFSI